MAYGAFGHGETNGSELRHERRGSAVVHHPLEFGTPEWKLS
jgi:hypothetical protein